MTTLEAAASPATRTRDLRPAAYTLFALLVLAQVAITVFSWWEPAFDGEIRYQDIAPLGGSYWPMNVLLGGPGYAVGSVATSVFLVVLGAGRGNVLALTGSTLHLLAGLVFALVITAEVLPFAWAADPSIVPADQGQALFAAYDDRFDAFLPYILGSMALVALGALLGVTGAAISGGLPWWLVAVTIVLIALLFVLPLGSPLTVPVDLAQRAVFLFIGWRGLRAMTAGA